jgi:hypothetical protein
MTITARVRERLYRSEILSRGRDYSFPIPRIEQLEEQLQLWNAEWLRITNEVPYWKEIRASRGLPLEFKSWPEFFANLPVMARADLKRDRARMISTKRPPISSE